MNNSTGKKCGRFIVTTVTLSLFSVPFCWAQDSSGSMGGLRGPQDIINSVNNRDSYGNPVQPVQGGYGSPPGGSEPAGSIQPFTNAPYPNAGGGAYLPPPAARAGGAPAAYGAPQGGAPPFQGAPPASYKQHHHHHKKQTAFQQSQAASQFNGQPGYPPQGDPSLGQQSYGAPGAYPNAGGYPNPGMSGPPQATGYRPKNSGNSSVGGAVVGVPDRAAKTAVGVPLKAGKEVLKALF